MTARAESEILEAFNSIHSLGVIHGDVRADNILVSNHGNGAWIIDFEFAEIISDMDDAKHSKLSQEMKDVNTLLEGIKNHHNPRRPCGNGSEEAPLGNGTVDSGYRTLQYDSTGGDSLVYADPTSTLQLVT